MGTGSFPGVESGRGVTLTPHPLSVPRSENQSSTIPLLYLRGNVACKKGKIYLQISSTALNTSADTLRVGCVKISTVPKIAILFQYVMTR
jgi:hypothetical protein